MNKVAEEQVEDLTPDRMWSDYVSKRRPVLISGHIMDAGYKAAAKWDLAYLKKEAGSCEVRVEKRERSKSGGAAAYGQGNKVDMAMHEFLGYLSEGREDLYLSTQDLHMDESDGHPVLYTDPLTTLSHDFVRRPQLLGCLVPQSINVWMGNSSDGASSGLHVDFHDNLYLLIRGLKKFRLFPPHLASRMELKGKLKKVHSNGRLVFQGQGDVLADGSDARDVETWLAKAEAEASLQAAEQAFQEEDNEETRHLLEEANKRLEASLDLELEAALGMGDDFDEIDEPNNDDYDKKSRGKKGKNSAKGKKGSRPKIDPPSFSHVDLNQDSKSLLRKYPDFPLSECLEVEVKAGQMLYLPCGWFHEVRSFSNPQEEGSRFHCALNYWFHPPDNLDPSLKGFKAPYSSDYYPSIWRNREALIHNDDGDVVQADEEEEEDDEEWEPDAEDLEEARREINFEDLPEEERNKIREAVRQMMMGGVQQPEPSKRVFREYKRPIGRRHHAVMYCKSSSKRVKREDIEIDR